MPERSPEIWDLISRMHQLEARVQSLAIDARGTEEARRLASVAAETAKRDARDVHTELQRVREIANQAVSRSELAYRRRQSRWLVAFGVVFALVLAAGFALLFAHTNRVEREERDFAYNQCVTRNQALDAQRQLYIDFIAAIKKEEGPGGAARVAAWQRALDALPPDPVCVRVS